jgi:DNA ligase-1
MDQSFQKWAETVQKIGDVSSTKTKTALCATYLSSIQSDYDLKLAARFLVEGPFAATSAERVAMGSRTYSTCAANFCNIDYEEVFKPCKRALADAPEVIEKLMRNIEAANRKRSPENLSLTEVEEIYVALSKVSTRVEKQRILMKVWKKMSPLEIKYFIRVMASGSLKVGLEAENIVAAISEAFDQLISDVRYVYTITGSIGQTAVLAKNDRLASASFSLFHPIPLMSGIAGKLPEKGELGKYVVEESFDGLRSQIHIRGKNVTIYSQNGEDITDYFPEIESFFTNRNIPGLVVEGVICAVEDDEILSGRYIRQRLRSKRNPLEKTNPVSAVYISVDIIYFNKEDLLKKKLVERRKVLTELAQKYSFPIAKDLNHKKWGISDKGLDHYLEEDRKNIILKKRNSIYEYGRESNSWLKMKRAGASLLVVLVYAHTDSSRRSGNYESFTVGIRVENDERYAEEDFIPIAKVDDQSTNIMKPLNEQIKELVVERFGPTRRLQPKMVIEIEFDEVRINKRRKANYILWNPRLKATHPELDPDQGNTLKDVEQIFRDGANPKPSKQSRKPLFYVPNK